MQRAAAGLLAFYDIDTPVTLAALAPGSCDYLSAELIPGFDLYLSFTGGPMLQYIERRYGAPRSAGALLFRRSGLSSPVYHRRGMGSRLSRHLQRRPSASARPADLWAGALLAAGALRRRGLALSVRTGVAEQSRPHRAHRSRAACEVFCATTLHAQRDAQRYDPLRLFAQRSPVRGRSLRRADHQRLVARSRRILPARPGNSYRFQRRAGPLLSARAARRRAAAACPSRPPARPSIIIPPSTAPPLSNPTSRRHAVVTASGLPLTPRRSLPSRSDCGPHGASPQ